MRVVTWRLDFVVMDFNQNGRHPMSIIQVFRGIPRWT
jgi:hypothetical protein